MSSVLAFDERVLAERDSAEAAARKICESAATGPVLAFCPGALDIAGRLSALGVRAVALSLEHLSSAFVRELLDLGVVAVVEAGCGEALSLGGVVKPSKLILYTGEGPLMSADASRVEGANLVPFASHIEVLELIEGTGSPVALRAVEEARARGVHYEVRRLGDDRGTLVRQDGIESASRPITSISVTSGVSFLSVRPLETGEPERWAADRARCLEGLAAQRVSVEMLQFTPGRLRFVIDERSLAGAQSVAQELGLAWRCVRRCAKLCIVGSGMRVTAGVAHKALAGLAELGIPVLHFSDSNVTMSLVIPQDRAEQAEAFLHGALNVGGEAAEAPVTFDAARGRVRVRGEEIRLGARQARLLEYLIENVGRIVEGEEAARYVFGSDSRDHLAALRVHMHHLRKKVEEDPDNPRFIVTVPGQGYLFVR